VDNYFINFGRISSLWLVLCINIQSYPLLVDNFFKIVDKFLII
jgi:hypothetical protein